MLICFYTFIIL